MKPKQLIILFLSLHIYVNSVFFSMLAIITAITITTNNKQILIAQITSTTLQVKVNEM